jgi:hypothetical protein
LPTSLKVLETADADVVSFRWAPAADKSSQPALDDLAWYDLIARYRSTNNYSDHLPFRDDTPYEAELPSSLGITQVSKHSCSLLTMGKYFERYDVCRLGEAIRYEDIPAGALKQRKSIFFREKFKGDGSFDKCSARCYTQTAVIRLLARICPHTREPVTQLISHPC